MSIPLEPGRRFVDSHRADAPPVVIVSKMLARDLWPSGNALGKPAASRRGRAQCTVAQRDRHRAGPAGELDRRRASGCVYTAVTQIEMMTDLVAHQRMRPRFLAASMTAFSLFAAVLAAAGLYSIVAYAVRQRSRDVAIHMALGADDRAVVSMFLDEAGWVVGVGVAYGVLASLVLTRSLASQLHGVTTLDGPAYFGSTVLLGAAALFAVWLPAGRATHTDPCPCYVRSRTPRRRGPPRKSSRRPSLSSPSVTTIRNLDDFRQLPPLEGIVPRSRPGAIVFFPQSSQTFETRWWRWGGSRKPGGPIDAPSRDRSRR